MQAQGGRGAGPAGRAILVHPDLVSRNHFPRDSPSQVHSSEEGPPFTGARHHMTPTSRSVEPSCVAPAWDAADLSGLPQAVVETITQARAPSTRQAYVLKLSLFANWCSSRQEDPPPPPPPKMHNSTGAGVLNLVLSLSLSHTVHWKFNMSPYGKELSEDPIKKNCCST